MAKIFKFLLTFTKISPKNAGKFEIFAYIWTEKRHFSRVPFGLKNGGPKLE